MVIMGEAASIIQGGGGGRCDTVKSGFFAENGVGHRGGGDDRNEEERFDSHLGSWDGSGCCCYSRTVCGVGGGRQGVPLCEESRLMGEAALS